MEQDRDRKGLSSAIRISRCALSIATVFPACYSHIVTTALLHVLSQVPHTVCTLQMLQPFATGTTASAALTTPTPNNNGSMVATTSATVARATGRAATTLCIPMLILTAVDTA